MNTPQWLDWSDENIQSNDVNRRLYKYTYGVKDVQIRYKEFEKASVFVSKPYFIDGNIIEVGLITDEDNYVTHANSNGVNPYDTAVEHYITFKEYPHADEWIPILPTGQERVPNELLILNGGQKGFLRFSCNTAKEIVVYKNNIKMPNEFWSYCSDNSIIIDKYFDRYATYTVAYYPNQMTSDPWNIELKEEDRKIVPYKSVDGTDGEVFRNGTDRNGIVTLTKYPYIDYARINSNDITYTPVNISLENANIAGPNRTVFSLITKDTTPATKNITDYISLSEAVLRSYDVTLTGQTITYPYFEYVQDGRKLYFTETFNNSSIISNMATNHGDAWIRVKYNFLQTQFRFKTILRNTSSKANSVTPSVNSYSLVFKVMR